MRKRTLVAEMDSTATPAVTLLVVVASVTVRHSPCLAPVRMLMMLGIPKSAERSHSSKTLLSSCAESICIFVILVGAMESDSRTGLAHVITLFLIAQLYIEFNTALVR